MTVNIIPFQPHLSPALPTVVGNVDYQTFRRQLDRIDQLLDQGGVENRFVLLSMYNWHKQKVDPALNIDIKQQLHFQQHSRRALRCNLARTLLGESHRGFSARLADSPMLQKFCLLDTLGVIRVPGKSTMQRYAAWLPAASMREVINPLLQQAGVQAGQLQRAPMELAQPLDMETVFIDTTCVKANIHFPVDWVLLRDATRTLMKAVILIRAQGLKHRMDEPEQFVREMNQLSIAMTMTRRKANGKRVRKKVLRQMKRMVRRVQEHAQRHRELLSQEWRQTQWTEKEAQQVLARIDRVLELLPWARKQAHERIIGERPVKSTDKLLSLYETDVRVIVRGKADAEVEFGNTLYLAENRQGVIVDYHLWRESAPADSKMVVESLKRMMEITGKDAPPQVQSVAADRGFDSAKTRNSLDSEGIYNGICPRSPAALKQRLQEEEFVACQRRRSQTEARIGIFKNQFLGRPLRAKGFEHRELAVAWGVLTHNLWVIARMPLREEAATEPQAA
jgi:gas vesicle protein